MVYLAHIRIHIHAGFLHVALRMVVCTGCGEDLANKQSDRRSLQCAAANGVLEVWKDVLRKMGREDQVNKVNYSHKRC